MHYFSIFLKRFNKQCVKYLRVWTKTANCWEILKVFDENSIEKWNVYFILENVTKNRAFGKNNIFQQQFFSVSGGFHPFPLATPLTRNHLSWIDKEIGLFSRTPL